MLNFGKFHDKEYDGVVLHIPSWFIKMNDLETALEELKKKFEECSMSIYHQDHLNNIYELENLADKKEAVEYAKQKEKETEQRRQEYHNKLISGEIVELVWSKRTNQLDNEYVRFKGEVYDYSDYMTNKLNVKESFVSKIKSQILTLEDLKEFASQNSVALNYDCTNVNEELINIDISFYCTSTCNLGISYQKRFCKYGWTKARKGGWQYYERPVVFVDGTYGIAPGMDPKVYNLLEGYELNQNILKKKI